jgi:aspartyl/asparaginyl-tRNA synthetase
MFEHQEIAAQVGQQARVEGFVRAVRMQSKMAFVVLESGPHRIQAVCFGAAREQAAELGFQSYAAIEGEVVAAAQAPSGFEIKASHVELVSQAMPWPVAPESEIGHALEWPAARFRERKEGLILAAQSQLEFHMMAHLQSQGFMGTHTPKLMGAPSESGSEVFEVKYFAEKAYLAQSCQLYKQMLIISGARKIYESASAFRAEKSYSTRHQTEFVSFDVELEGVKSEMELVELECAMLHQGIKATLASMGAELTAHYPKATQPGPVKILTFRAAQALLGISGAETLSAEEERRLGAMMMEQGHELVALIQVPWSQRPFYHMKETVGSEQLTRSFELIYRGVEITTGAIREHRHATLMAQLAEKGLTGKGMEFYLDSFKLGAPPHGGFGLGLTRLVMLFLGLPGIKEASFIHRGPSRLTP